MVKQNTYIRVAKESDKDDILKILNSGFERIQKTTSESKRNDFFWNWKYKESNFGKSILHVAVNKGGIVGTGTLWPFKFKYQGRILRAYQPCDTLVDKKWRGHGIFSRINEQRIKIAKEQNVDFLFNFPNNNSLKGYLKKGWHFVGNLTWTVKILKPISVLKGFRKELKSEKIDVGDKYNIRSIKQPLIKEPVAEKITLYKDSGYYKWRYIDHPSRNYGFVSIQGSNVFAVFTLMKNQYYIEMLLTELHYDSQSNLIKLLKKVSNVAKELDAGLLAFCLSDQLNYKLKCILFLFMFLPKKNKNFVVLPISKIGYNATKFENWSFQLALHDTV